MLDRMNKSTVMKKAGPRLSLPVMNTRKKLILYVSIATVYLAVVLIAGIVMNPELYAVNYENKFISPSFAHIFGTDFMGRDMFWRCIKGLSNSILIGVLAATVSSIIALGFGMTAAMAGGKVDRLINWCVDCCMGMPHLVLLILISYMMGRGGTGVAVAAGDEGQKIPPGHEVQHLWGLAVGNEQPLPGRPGQKGLPFAGTQTGPDGRGDKDQSALISGFHFRHVFLGRRQVAALQNMVFRQGRKQLLREFGREAQTKADPSGCMHERPPQRGKLILCRAKQIFCQ